MTIEVNLNEWIKLPCPEYPEDISTGGLGPCFGIIIYNPTSKVTFAGHFVSPHMHESDLFEKMLDCAIAEFTNSGDVRVYASGCVLNESESREKRLYVERTLMQKCPDNFYKMIEWPKEQVTSVEMILNPEDGFFEIRCADT